MNSGDRDLNPIGFPTKDVFLYDGEPDEVDLDLRKLRPWSLVQTSGRASGQLDGIKVKG